MAIALCCIALAWPAAAHAESDSVVARIVAAVEESKAVAYEHSIAAQVEERIEALADNRWRMVAFEDDMVTVTYDANPETRTKEGDRIASAAVAMAGFARTGKAVGPKDGDRKTMPPDVGRGGDWTVHNKVAKAITKGVRHLYAECSASVTLVVRWSGVDDDFSAGSTSQQYRYLMRSDKWERVGGEGKYLRKTSEPDEGVDVRPGDILVAKECEKGKNSHIAIYVGTEYGDLKFPGKGVYYFESKAQDSCWTCLAKWKGMDFCVFRRTDVDLDLDASRYADIYPEERLEYSLWKEPEISSYEMQATRTYF